MNIAKTKLVVVDNTPIYMYNVLIEMSKATYTWDNTIASRKRTSTKRYSTTKNHGSICQTPGYPQKQPRHLLEETGVQPLCASNYDIMEQRPGH